MDCFDEIYKILEAIESKNPGCLDSLDDNAVNNIPEVKAIRNKWRIKNFKVNRDNETMVRGDCSTKNIGGNKLKGFSFQLIPGI